MHAPTRRGPCLIHESRLRHRAIANRVDLVSDVLVSGRLRTDLVIDPFGASMLDIVAVARCADDAGFAGVWTFDHFNAAVMDAPWSRDPFVMLGAIAAVTSRVQLGLLVANAQNRHVAQLASALNSVQSLAPGRVRCGLGSGAGPTGRFAVEPQSVARAPLAAAARRQLLVETIEALRALYSGRGDYSGEHVTLRHAVGVVDGAPCPEIIIGATGPATIGVAAAHADGVNIRRTADLEAHLQHAASSRPDRPFEISVFEKLDPSHPLGGDPDWLLDRGVARRTLVVTAPYPMAAVAAIGQRLRCDG
jgi:alkanesulfonate monooxygenase SsuD/methylene tetrahydromethanopterin reductase-like flavin-dependent oxidoreductase (luciferase family)